MREKLALPPLPAPVVLHRRSSPALLVLEASCCASPPTPPSFGFLILSPHLPLLPSPSALFSPPLLSLSASQLLTRILIFLSSVHLSPFIPSPIPSSYPHLPTPHLTFSSHSAARAYSTWVLQLHPSMATRIFLSPLLSVGAEAVVQHLGSRASTRLPTTTTDHNTTPPLIPHHLHDT